MKNKIVLIEDRTERQRRLLSPFGLTVNDLLQKEGLDAGEFRIYLDSLENEKMEIFDEYDLIMGHKTALGSNSSRLIEYCEKERKDLILFSGGVSSSTFLSMNKKQSDDKECAYLQVSDVQFYSKHLIPFIEKYLKGDFESLIEIKEGENWRKGYLMRYRELLALEEADQREKHLKETINLEGILKFSNEESADESRSRKRLWVNKEISKQIANK